MSILLSWDNSCGDVALFTAPGPLVEEEAPHLDLGERFGETSRSDSLKGCYKPISGHVNQPCNKQLINYKIFHDFLCTFTGESFLGVPRIETSPLTWM